MPRFVPTTVAVALTWIASAALPAAAQRNYTAQVEFQFRLIRTFAESVGFPQVHKPLFSSLREDAEETQTLELPGNAECRVMALCDSDCSDVDIFVTDPAGREVGSDDGSSDAPVVAVRTTAEGEYRVRVRMATCRSEPCYYGVAVFGREAGR